MHPGIIQSLMQRKEHISPEDFLEKLCGGNHSLVGNLEGLFAEEPNLAKLKQLQLETSNFAIAVKDFAYGEISRRETTDVGQRLDNKMVLLEFNLNYACKRFPNYDIEDLIKSVNSFLETAKEVDDYYRPRVGSNE